MSALSDRLDRLERALSPTRAVVAWLTGAQAHGSLLAAAQASAADPSGRDPRERIIEQVAAWADQRSRGERDQARTVAITEAVTDALHAYDLVLTIETTTMRFIDRQDPTLGLWQHRLLEDIEECGLATERQPCTSRHWAADAARAAVAQVHQHEDACRRLAAAHLAGREARFPETNERWVRLEVLATMLASSLDRAPVCRAVRPAGVLRADWSFSHEVEVAHMTKAMDLSALKEAYRDLCELGHSPALAARRLADLADRHV